MGLYLRLELQIGADYACWTVADVADHAAVHQRQRFQLDVARRQPVNEEFARVGCNGGDARFLSIVLNPRGLRRCLLCAVLSALSLCWGKCCQCWAAVLRIGSSTTLMELSDMLPVRWLLMHSVQVEDATETTFPDLPSCLPAETNTVCPTCTMWGLVRVW